MSAPRPRRHGVGQQQPPRAPLAPMGARAVGIALGVALDAIVGDPRRGHPVAGFGVLAGRVERAVYRDSRAAGVGYVVACLGGPVLAAYAVARHTRSMPWAQVSTTAAVTWTALGARGLVTEGRAMAEALAAGDLDGARRRLPSLCGRLADGLDDAELARATVESLAENSSDAIVGTLVWGAVAGLPGIVWHRCANTLDAMVGHRSPRHARFGWAAARLDDVANLVPARLTGLLWCLLAPVVGGRPADAWRAMVRDHAAHPSPNGGWCEAAAAGALGVRLGGRNVYPGGRVELRGRLGDGPECDVDAVRRARRSVQAVTVGGTALALAWCHAVGLRGVRRGAQTGSAGKESR